MAKIYLAVALIFLAAIVFCFCIFLRKCTLESFSDTNWCGYADESQAQQCINGPCLNTNCNAGDSACFCIADYGDYGKLYWDCSISSTPPQPPGFPAAKPFCSAK